ncbi:MAG TPA: VOC family protein [Burkholderiales bacterium]|nr:VOC family protein [Burkholderiales bacterium]
MPVTELNHFLIRANNLERTKDFYCKVLGFEVMPRPDFPFPGYWLGIDGKIQVHMAQAGVPNSQLYYLGSPKNAAKDNSGVIDHVAFLATDPEGFVRHLKTLGVLCRPRNFPESQLFQLFVKDPDGLTVELNFFGVTKAPDWGGEDYSRMPRASSTKSSAKSAKKKTKAKARALA